MIKVPPPSRIFPKSVGGTAAGSVNVSVRSGRNLAGGGQGQELALSAGEDANREVGYQQWGEAGFTIALGDADAFQPIWQRSPFGSLCPFKNR